MSKRVYVVLGVSGLLILMFQNCAPTNIQFSAPSAKVAASSLPDDLPIKPVVEPSIQPEESVFIPDVAEGPGVVTVLMAMGDQDIGGERINDIVPEEVIFKEAVAFASAIESPKILVVRDRNAGNESYPTTDYIAYVLLKPHDVTLIDEPSGGLSVADFETFDLVVLSNPGTSMASRETLQALIDFEGGVIMAGDDLSQGSGFATEELTGLKYISNGTSIKCGSQSFGFDNNLANQFAIKVIGKNLDLRYGNDVDFTEVTRNSLEVFATARYDVGNCSGEVPLIVGYKK